MEEIRQAIIAYLALLDRDDLKIIYLLIRKLARR